MSPSIQPEPDPGPEPAETLRFPAFNTWCLAILVMVYLAYANHFDNAFHFDDSHTVESNPWIRDLGNIPRFFTDGTTFSTLPANRSYRPLVSTSLALDYYLSGGLKPRWFHISTFAWFLVQLGLMFLLFRLLLKHLVEAELGRWLALAATAAYGLHPAMAETVNYVIQRGDLYVAVGVVASLYWYLAIPRHRRFGFYLVPLVAAILCKPPAMVMPALLIAALYFLEGDSLATAVRKSVPSLVVVALTGWFVVGMTPQGYTGGASSAFGYRLTQPSVLLHYFQTFFIPAGLTADTDRSPYAGLFEGDALVGFLFVAVLLAVIVGGAQYRALGPITFGLSWFLITSLPTSLFPLAEVENDHRMFLPFVGLALSAAYAGSLLVRRYRWKRMLIVAVCAALAAGLAAGTRARNRVWATDEALWLDVTIKSPRNGRGLMNYGLTQMSKGNYPGALEYFERALALTPNYYALETNLGIVNGELGRIGEAERHFMTAQQLAPNEMTTHFFFALWLNKAGRLPEAVQQLRSGIEHNPDYLDARYLLLQIFGSLGDSEGVTAAAKATLARFPADKIAADWLARAPNLRPAPSSPAPVTPGSVPAGSVPAGLVPAGSVPVINEAALIEQSLAFFRLGKYEDCVRTAETVARLRPTSTAAWNNMGACYNGMKAWAKAIPALEQAVRLQPDFQLAKNNLTWARKELANAAH